MFLWEAWEDVTLLDQMQDKGTLFMVRFQVWMFTIRLYILHPGHVTFNVPSQLPLGAHSPASITALETYRTHGLLYPTWYYFVPEYSEEGEVPFLKTRHRTDVPTFHFSENLIELSRHAAVLAKHHALWTLRRARISKIEHITFPRNRLHTRKHETLIQYRLNVTPTSATLAQH